MPTKTKGRPRSVDDCRATLDSLHTKRAAAAETVAELVARREALALEAQSSQAAADKLADVRREAVEAQIAVEDLDAAIRAAEAELAEAERRAADEAEAKLLQQADAIVDERLAAAAEIDRLAAELGQAFERYDATGDQLHRLYMKAQTARGVPRHKLANLSALAGALHVAAPRLMRALNLFTQRDTRGPLVERERRLFGRQGHNAEAGETEAA